MLTAHIKTENKNKTYKEKKMTIPKHFLLIFSYL